MAQKRYGVDQIVLMLRRADVELGKGKKVPEVCKRLGITQQTYYRWRQKYGGMAPEMAKELKALQKENTRLKKLVADQAPGQRHLEGSREGKLLSPEQRRLACSASSISWNRKSEASAYSSFFSTAIHFRPNRSATCPVVFDPAKGSRTQWTA